MGNLSNRLNRGAQAPQAAASAATAKGASRYAGIEPTEGNSTPEPGYGDYVLEITKASYERSKRAQTEYYEALFTVVESEGEQASPPGSVVRFGQDVNIVGVKIIRDFIMAANGFDDLDAFNEFAARTPDTEVEAVDGKRIVARCSPSGKSNGKGGVYTDWLFAPDN